MCTDMYMAKDQEVFEDESCSCSVHVIGTLIRGFGHCNREIIVIHGGCEMQTGSQGQGDISISTCNWLANFS